MVHSLLDNQWKQLYKRFYELELMREESRNALEEERKQLVQVHEEATKKWSKYEYYPPGESDRLQLYAGEIRSMGEVLLIDRVEDGVNETNLMPCGYNEFLELMTVNLEAKREQMPYKEFTRASAMQRAYKKFKGDLELIALKPEAAPKQRIVMMQILICKLIDLIDPVDPNGEPPLVKRDFRLAPFTPVTPAQEAYLSDVDSAVDKIHTQTDRIFVQDVQAVTILERLEQIKHQERQRKEAEAELLLLEKGENDEVVNEKFAALQNTELDGKNKIVEAAMMKLFKSRAKQTNELSTEDTISKDIEQHVELSNDMDTIEKFNMKAGELERLKLAKRYRSAEKFIEENRFQSMVPVFEDAQPQLQMRSKKRGQPGKGGHALAPSPKLKFTTAVTAGRFGIRIAPENKEL